MIGDIYRVLDLNELSLGLQFSHSKATHMRGRILLTKQFVC